MSTERELLERLQRALEAADVDADALIDAAWSDARDDVRSTLRRLFTHDLLTRALASLEDQPAASPSHTDGAPVRTAAPAGPPRTAEPPTDGGHQEAVPDARAPAADVAVTCLFAVVPAAAPPAETTEPALPGGGPLRGIEVGGLRAVVCDVDAAAFEGLRDPDPDSLELLASLAYAHDRILAHLAAEGTVLPLSLGTVLPDDDTVITLLRDHEATLVAELDRLQGHAEWAVTVRQVEEPVAASTTVDPGSSGRDYLRRQQASQRSRGERWQLRQELATAIHDRLAATASEATTVGSRPVEDAVPPLLHGVYLVHQHRRDAFDREVEALREEHPSAVLDVSGPFPPYHFSHVQLGGEVSA